MEMNIAILLALGTRGKGVHAKGGKVKSTLKEPSMHVALRARYP